MPPFQLGRPCLTLGLMAQDPLRTRPSPAQRFTGDQHVYELSAIADELRRHHPQPHGGHRQITLLKHSAGTLSLFDWEAGGALPEHKTSGYVTIQVLQGRLRVTTPDEEHDLPAGRLLVMSPNVAHSVRAQEASQMLLTVNLV